MFTPYFKPKTMEKHKQSDESFGHGIFQENRPHYIYGDNYDTPIEERINNLFILISIIIAVILFVLGLKLSWWSPLINTGGLFVLFWLWQVFKWLTKGKITKVWQLVSAIAVFFLMCGSFVYELLAIFGK